MSQEWLRQETGSSKIKSTDIMICQDDVSPVCTATLDSPTIINVFSVTWIKTCSTMGNTEFSPQASQRVTFSCKAPVNTDILKWLSCSSSEWGVLKTSWSWRSPTRGWFYGKQGQPHSAQGCGRALYHPSESLVSPTITTETTAMCVVVLSETSWLRPLDTTC